MLQRKAFTLIEMVMVLMIVALMAAIVVPQWNRFVGAWDVETETQKMAAKIRQVQQDAIAHQKVSQIVFDIPNESYTVKRDNIVVEGPVYFPGGVTVSALFMNPSETVQFDQFGAIPTGGLIILSKPFESKVTYLQLEPVTGNINWSSTDEEGFNPPW